MDHDAHKMDGAFQPGSGALRDKWRNSSLEKQQHTIETQVAVDGETGRFVDVPDSVPSPTSDLTVLEQSGLLQRLPPGVRGLGDQASSGGEKLVPGVPVAAPRRKPRGQPRPPMEATTRGYASPAATASAANS